MERSEHHDGAPPHRDVRDPERGVSPGARLWSGARCEPVAVTKGGHSRELWAAVIAPSSPICRL